jgi:hypothetical protein
MKRFKFPILELKPTKGQLENGTRAVQTRLEIPIIAKNHS